MNATAKETKKPEKASGRASEGGRKTMLYVGLAVAVIALGVMVRRTLGDN